MDKITVRNFEFPPVDYPDDLGRSYQALKDISPDYGDTKSFICFDAGYRAALEFIDKKLKEAK